MKVRDTDLRVVGDSGVALDAAVDLERDSGADVIVLRARYSDRNRDYNQALETILSRLSRAGIRFIAVQIASSETRDRLDDAERLVRVDGSPVIELGEQTAAELRRLIGRSVAATGRRPTGEKERARSGGGNPTKRLLIDAGIGRNDWFRPLQPAAETGEVAIGEARPPEYGRRVLRPEQPGFRRALLLAYQHRCAVTATGVAEVLEAAHIVPYHERSSHEPRNGLLLRRDIHALFDADLLGIDLVHALAAPVWLLSRIDDRLLFGRRARVAGATVLGAAPLLHQSPGGFMAAAVRSTACHERSYRPLLTSGS